MACALPILCLSFLLCLVDTHVIAFLLLLGLCLVRFLMFSSYSASFPFRPCSFFRFTVIGSYCSFLVLCLASLLSDHSFHAFTLSLLFGRPLVFFAPIRFLRSSDSCHVRCFRSDSCDFRCFRSDSCDVWDFRVLRLQVLTAHCH